ncbi:hypothetical protein SAMN05192557_0786 [Aliicoccus persicus]|uniref:Uncharacterized protein n=1 Tax=Aliicoccus persicus TaxID=930138 RepID=A0A662Z441_9STAP|nr:hypothetical protein SAMN05192557_0786 [Aliicoccus persicus]
MVAWFGWMEWDSRGEKGMLSPTKRGTVGFLRSESGHEEHY